MNEIIDIFINVSLFFFKDKDGFITIEEFRAYYAKTNKDGLAIEKAFAAIDADKDGLVTFEGNKLPFVFSKSKISLFLEFERAYKE
jgi:Ca2+-binding EF-hand superfamily protein